MLTESSVTPIDQNTLSVSVLKQIDVSNLDIFDT